jgi:hypothetical protein
MSIAQFVEVRRRSVRRVVHHDSCQLLTFADTGWEPAGQRKNISLVKHGQRKHSSALRECPSITLFGKNLEMSVFNSSLRAYADCILDPKMVTTAILTLLSAQKQENPSKACSVESQARRLAFSSLDAATNGLPDENTRDCDGNLGRHSREHPRVRNKILGAPTSVQL